MRKERQEHPSPQVLVDLVEEAPIDAMWKDHLSRCEYCTAEVEKLRKTLALASDGEPPEPGSRYWDDFNIRLSRRLDHETKRYSSGWLWAAAAAALLAVGIWAVRDRTESPTSAPPTMMETILPPVEEDTEFQVLLSIARVSGNGVDIEESLDLAMLPTLDPGELNTEEQEQLRRELEKRIEVENHAKS